MSELPQGWAGVPIGDVTIDTAQRVPDDSESFWYIDIASIDRETKKISSPQQLLGKDAPSRARKVVRTGDVLVSMTRPNLNSVAMVPNDLDEQIASTGFDVLRTQGLDSRWLFYLVRTSDFVGAMSSLVQGALYPAIRSKDVRSYRIPLPPFNEQKRIADKLDTLLKRVDACRERLDRVPLILKRFRQAVLAAATSGALTEDWRETQSGYEWMSNSIADVCNVVRGASPRPAGDPRYFGGEIPWITVGELTKDNLKYLTSVSSFVTDEGRKRSRYIEPGTLLLSNSGATLGVPKITSIGGCINDGSVALIGLEEPLKSYLYYVLAGMTEALRSLNQGAAQPNLNTTIVKNINFMLPRSGDEQHEIVRRVEKLFAYADKLEARYATARRQVEQLTPALLAKAFRGELVEQDPSDEPASVLLERIRVERSGEGAKPKRTPAGRSPRKVPVPEPEPLPLAAEAAPIYGTTVPQRILAAMQPGRDYSRADLLVATGISESEWLWSIRQLKGEGAVVQEGERRGARYRKR